MDVARMLHSMCHEVLSEADLKAISKSRGFSAHESASRALFENFFLSDIGVETALHSLTQEEITLLHLLTLIDEPVSVAFFARLYAEGPDRYGTFTQRYQPVFQQAKTSLMRKGILLMAEAENAGHLETRMERWRFWFPREFERWLPLLVRSARTFEEKGEARSDILRRKLLELVGESLPEPSSVTKPYKLKLLGGKLFMGEHPYRAQHLLEWQRAAWAAEAPLPKSASRTESKDKAMTPMDAAVYAFSRLGHAEWIRSDDLALPLKIFCNAPPHSEDVCEAGWKWGCLARLAAPDGRTYYRLLSQENKTQAPRFYMAVLTSSAQTSVVINLETIPFVVLEHLRQIAQLQIAQQGQPHLIATPDLVELGRVLDSVRDQPVLQWLRDNSPAFQQAVETVEQRWGKQIVHQNLLLARVNDPSLRVELERAFPSPGQLVVLSDDYVGFPCQLLPLMEKVIARSGHVIKKA